MGTASGLMPSEEALFGDLATLFSAEELAAAVTISADDFWSPDAPPPPAGDPVPAGVLLKGQLCLTLFKHRDQAMASTVKSKNSSAVPRLLRP